MVPDCDEYPKRGGRTLIEKIDYPKAARDRIIEWILQGWRRAGVWLQDCIPAYLILKQGEKMDQREAHLVHMTDQFGAALKEVLGEQGHNVSLRGHALPDNGIAIELTRGGEGIDEATMSVAIEEALRRIGAEIREIHHEDD